MKLANGRGGEYVPFQVRSSNLRPTGKSSVGSNRVGSAITCGAPARRGRSGPKSDWNASKRLRDLLPTPCLRRFAVRVETNPSNRAVLDGHPPSDPRTPELRARQHDYTRVSFR